jgi:hypothetical protein
MIVLGPLLQLQGLVRGQGLPWVIRINSCINYYCSPGRCRSPAGMEASKVQGRAVAGRRRNASFAGLQVPALLSTECALVTRPHLRKECQRQIAAIFSKGGAETEYTHSGDVREFF